MLTMVNIGDRDIGNRVSSMSRPTIVESMSHMAQLKPGQWATIIEVQTGASDRMRLMGLGICVGRRVKILKDGDPMILQVYDSRIGLSARLGRRVIVIAQAEGEAGE